MRSNKLTKLALLLALALIFSYIESLILFPLGIPGMKLGLANLMTVLVLYAYDAKTAFGLNAMRIVIAGFLFGNLFGITYSFAGAIVSFLMMVFCKKVCRLPIVVTSIAGGVFHNVGQVLFACMLLESFVMFYYLPALMISGMITGFLIGLLGKILFRRGLL